MDSPVKATTILVVDDDVLIGIGTADMLTDLGHRAIEANSGKEALDILASGEAVDMVITDYGMPGMNGVELAAQMLAMRPNLPILLATGYDCLPDGDVTDLPKLNKPFQMAELSLRLREVLDRVDG